MIDCPFTTRERECVKWLSEGHTVPEVADILGMAKYTVQVRIRDAKEKAGVSTAASLVAKSIRNGWIA